MQGGPFENEPPCPGWKPPADDFDRGDGDQCFVLAAARVKVGRTVFTVEHSDDDTVELANPRHVPAFILNHRTTVLIEYTPAR